MEKLLPQNIEAECGVLGSVIIDPEAVVQVADFLQAEDFYRDAHRTIYETILGLYEQREPADFITICDELERQNKLETVGGPSYITSLVNQVPTSGNVEYYGRIVERMAILRRLIHAAGQIAAVAYEESDANAAMDKSEQLIYNISQRHARSDFSNLRELLSDYMSKLDQLHERRGAIVGVPTGFTDLDRLTGGLQKSDLVILAARPAVGKCLPAWSLIDDPETGERITIEECVQRRLPKIHSLSEHGAIHVAEIGDWIDSGIKPCYRVRTRLGRMVEVTGHHPFLTVQGWKPLNELEVGNHIAVPTRVECFGTDESLPIEKVRLLAYSIAEGVVKGKQAQDKCFPEYVWKWSRRYLAAFLQALLSHKGNCYQDTSIMFSAGSQRLASDIQHALLRFGIVAKLSQKFERCWYVEITEAEQVKRYWDVISQNEAGGGSAPQKRRVRPSWSPVSGPSLPNWWSKSGRGGPLWSPGRESAPSQELVESSRNRVGAILYGRPAGGKGPSTKFTKVLIEEMIHERAIINSCLEAVRLALRIGRSQRDGGPADAINDGPYSLSNTLKGTGKLRTMPDRWMQVKRAKTVGTQFIASVARHPVCAPDALRRIASPDIYWDEIVSIESIGEHQVYDLTVPDGANFIAQDVFVHNTSLCLSIAHNAAVKHGRSVAVFSLEMSKEQLVQRLLSMDAAIDQQRLRTGWIEDDEWDRIVTAMGVLSEANIWIDDTAGISTMEMRSKARRLQAEHGVDLIIVDYLQLMQSTSGGKRNENRVQEISEISRNLKGLARELNVPVMALAQLSRAVESRQSKVPQLSDLRESGCVVGDTQVYLPDTGKYCPIKDLVGKKGFRVLALNTQTWQLEPREVTNAFATGHKPVYKLTTRLGRVVRATGNHKYLTIHGWKRLDELTTEDRIALPRRLTGPTQATMSDHELALLGHLIGDGCTLPRHAIQYTTNDETLAEVVATLATNVFGDRIVPRIKKERDWYQVYLAASYHLTHDTRNPITEWLQKLGVFGLRSHEKRVPESVFAQPAESIGVFLRHLWSTDGCIHLSQGNKHYANIYYASSSEQLARQVQSLLLRLEINAKLARRSQGSKGRDQYHVIISGKGDIEKFLQRVGGLGQNKELHHHAIANQMTLRVANTNRDVIPYMVWQLLAVPAMQIAGITTRQMQAGLGNAYCGTSIYKQNLSRERATKLAQVVMCEQLAMLAQSDVYWDEIISIEPDGSEDVFDITVDELHNFIGNDLVQHNSIEQDADVVMFIYREDVYNPETERKNIADIIVAKHRNGPVGEVSLFFQASQTRFADLELTPPPEE